MAESDVHGPIDFVLLEFEAERMHGRAAEELLRLVDQGTIRLYDVLFLGKSNEGEVFALDLAETAAAAGPGFDTLAGASSGLLQSDDITEAGSALRPGTVAALIVYENAWAIPFVGAAREAGGELVAGARLPAADVMAALDSLDAADQTTISR